MPTPSLTDAQLRQTVDYVRAAVRDGHRPPGVSCGNNRAGAVAIAAERAVADGVISTANGFKSRFRYACERGFGDPSWGTDEAIRPAAPFTVTPPPMDAAPKSHEELIAARMAAFARKQAKDDYRKAIDVHVTMPGPIGVCFFGDPHLDNDGTNWPLLKRHIEAVQDTPGMMACSVGDYRDNWIGRLTSIYASGGAKVDEGVALLEWFCEQIPWLALTAGNHDNWGRVHGDVLGLISRLKAVPGPSGQDDMRLRLHLPGGASFTIRMRHRFPGNSMYSAGHGAAKEALMGARDHVLAAGDIHSADLRTIWHESEQRLCLGLQVGAYKQIDDYAVEKGFRPNNWTPNMAVVVDPAMAGDPLRFITAFWDLEEACDFLTWKRSRFDGGPVPVPAVPPGNHKKQNTASGFVHSNMIGDTDAA